jgi:Zn-dependent peptidase ImmA (M78 family)
MVDRATGINPEMLRWARERAGYSVEDIATRRRVPSDRVLAWESGLSYPTWRQLENLAYEDYHRPTVLFFLREPPSENSVATEFRRLPGATLNDSQPDTLYAIRQAKQRQTDLSDLIGSDGAGERFILGDLRWPDNAVVPTDLALAVREYLGVSLHEQISWRHADNALTQWRSRVEEVGVWVFKRSFKQTDVAGFCLNHNTFPVIYLNDGQAKVRQIFTLFHELAHLLFDFNHLERVDDMRYVDMLSGADRAIEISCNRFAGEFLVPSVDFEQAVASQPHNPISDEVVANLAKRYVVSREVILRKFFDQGRLEGDLYRQTLAGWRSGRSASSGGGGNYFATQAIYLGKKYLRVAFLAWEENRIDNSKLANILGVKGSSLDRLERYAWQ